MPTQSQQRRQTIRKTFSILKKLRGFEKGKVGPKDGNDFIGGNFAAGINFNSSLPFLFENLQNIETSFF